MITKRLDLPAHLLGHHVSAYFVLSLILHAQRKLQELVAKIYSEYANDYKHLAHTAEDKSELEYLKDLYDFPKRISCLSKQRTRIESVLHNTENNIYSTPKPKTLLTLWRGKENPQEITRKELLELVCKYLDFKWTVFNHLHQTMREYIANNQPQLLDSYNQKVEGLPFLKRKMWNNSTILKDYIQDIKNEQNFNNGQRGLPEHVDKALGEMYESLSTTQDAFPSIIRFTQSMIVEPTVQTEEWLFDTFNNRI
eukprot:2230280-Rhodomonas_salina.1